MADPYQRRTASAATARAGDRAGVRIDTGVDEGLRAYMLRVYNLMALGIALTGVLAYLLATTSFGIPILATIMGTPLVWVVFGLWIGLGFFGQRLFFSQNPALGHFVFWAYCFLGSLIVGSVIFRFLAAGDYATVVMAFLVTTVLFAGLSITGYATKKDLSWMGGYLAAGILAIIAIALLNIFIFQSGLTTILISVVIIPIMLALIAYETQQVKHLYYSGDAQGMTEQKAVFGAFLFYTSFIILFVHILNLLGLARD